MVISGSNKEFGVELRRQARIGTSGDVGLKFGLWGRTPSFCNFESKVDPDVQRLDSALRLAGFLMTMPEVFAYVTADTTLSLNALQKFSGITTAQEGQVAIDALVAEARAAFAPASEGGDSNAKQKAIEELDALLMKMGVLVSGEYQKLDNPARLVIEANLCAEHGIHQLDEEIQK